MTEIEERRRRQTWRTLITEVFMFITIVVLVVVLALVAMGYRLNFEKGVEHSGLVQINSIPSGAAITVDGEGVFLPTNQSRTMVSGPHDITLTRDGFTSWSKTINVTEGMMYRLSYPRLYKEQRETVAINLALEDETEPLLPQHAFISSDRKTMLLTYENNPTWRYFNLNDRDSLIRSVSVEGIISGDVEIVEWLDNNNRLLLRDLSTHDWLILNLSRPAESINLSQEFGLDFSTIRSGSGDKLIVCVADSLRELDLSSKEISKVLLSEIVSFTNSGSNIIYISEHNIYSFSIGDTESKLIQELEIPDTGAPLLSINEYYGDYYLACAIDQKLYIYSGRALDKMNLIVENELSFAPKSLEVRGDGELIVASDNQELAVFDAENYTVTEFTAESTPVWLTEFDFYTLKDTWLTVHDFDYSNPHALIEGVAASLPATISDNDHYIYYFNTDLVLQRETIR